MTKPKKADLVALLEQSMTEEQWGLISRLRGRPAPPTPAKRRSLLSGLFHRTITRDAAKGKGRALQQWACQQIAQATGLAWGKDEDIASREGGQSGPDVRLAPRARGLFPFTVECKSGTWNLPAAIRQAQANLYKGTDWLVALDRPSPRRDERIPPIVVLDGVLFFLIWEKYLLWEKGHAD